MKCDNCKHVYEENEKRFKDGADLVITPIDACINNKPPTTGKLISAAR